MRTEPGGCEAHPVHFKRQIRLDNRVAVHARRHLIAAILMIGRGLALGPAIVAKWVVVPLRLL